MPTKIDWCDEVWNVVTGCSPISEGCQNCYAKRMAKRLRGRFGYPKGDPFKPGTFHKDKLNLPYKWRKSRRIFVCSMGDIFHDNVKEEWIDEILNVIYRNPKHIFMLLTKRPKRAYDISKKFGFPSNVWLGVTAENQRMMDERLTILLSIPAAKRFVSIEPILEPVKLRVWIKYSIDYGWPDSDITKNKPDLVIAGPETGPGKRPYQIDWFRDLRNQCCDSEVPFFLKGGLTIDGKKYEEFPNANEH